MAVKATGKSEAKANAASKPIVIENASVPDSYADDFVGLYGIGPNFHLTFATRRPIEGGKPEFARHVTARLVLPLDAMIDLYNSLQTAVGRLESSGVIKRDRKG